MSVQHVSSPAAVVEAHLKLQANRDDPDGNKASFARLKPMHVKPPRSDYRTVGTRQLIEKELEDSGLHRQDWKLDVISSYWSVTQVRDILSQIHDTADAAHHQERLARAIVIMRGFQCAFDGTRDAISHAAIGLGLPDPFGKPLDPSESDQEARPPEAPKATKPRNKS